MTVVQRLAFGWWHVAAVLVESAVVEPVDPFQGGHFDLVDSAPRPERLDQFGLVETVDRLGQGVVKELPVAPIEASMPASINRSVNAIDVYWVCSIGRCNTGLL